MAVVHSFCIKVAVVNFASSDHSVDEAIDFKKVVMNILEGVCISDCRKVLIGKFGSSLRQILWLGGHQFIELSIAAFVASVHV